MNDKSLRMSAYNYAKWFGRKTAQFDTKRVDRALGYLMSDECHAKWNEYGTTLETCGCPDHCGCKMEDGVIVATWLAEPYCKHIIAMMIQVKMDQLRKEKVHE